MNDGRSRGDIAYIWPSSLRFDVPHQRSIYLDLNHWIGLAQADTGHRNGSRYESLLSVARSLADSSDVIFPLAGQHYMEMAAIKNPRQRSDIASVMRELSGYRTLLCRSSVMQLEVEAALDSILGLRPAAWVPLTPTNRGFGHAFGIEGKVRISKEPAEAGDETRSSWPGGPDAYDTLVENLQLESEWRMLRGPLDDELEQLDNLGYRPETARCIQTQRAQQEIQQAGRFNDDPRWRRGRIRDVILARYVVVELFDLLNEGLEARNTAFGEVFSDNREVPRSFVDAMPSGDVHVSLHVEAHRNAQAPWTPNDIFDIDSLSIAVPFCDVVLTDRRRARDLIESGCAERLGTKVFATPEELVAELA